MTWRARLFGLFPALWLALLLGCGFWLLRTASTAAALALLFVAYLLPVLCFRLHEAVWPLREGRSRIDAPGYSPWWGGHQFQLMYNAFPALEAALRLLPGAYSAWLRLWGSRIGRRVYWTPRVEIADRSLLDVGDGAVFGHLTACYAHLIKPHRGGLVLYVRRIHIGHGAFLSAGSRLGPGVRIADGTVLPLLSDVGVGRRVAGGD
ncbi:acyltransferase [Tahibacter harae]|uniref:Acyl transferase n=1 Tax=Tahibacter harae TaxID=2963937 RepID=A0ABT1QZD7_9GAMM|nr:hypothetical protein [Tahibacter harae]MCQ4167659.1 hypothetical protein [Tahibacter harae]